MAGGDPHGEEDQAYGQWTFVAYPQKGHWKMNAKMYENLNVIEWNQLFNLAEQTVEPLVAQDIADLLTMKGH